MTLEVWFWLLYILSLLFGFWAGYAESPGTWRYGAGRHLLFYILIGLLGLKVFGGPVK